MATITKTSLGGSGSRAMSVTVAGASDDFVYTAGDLLVIDNITAGALTPNLDGDGASTIPVPGYGSDLDVSGGYDVPSIQAGDKAVIPLDTISAWLKGTVAVTGADGAELSILTK